MSDQIPPSSPAVVPASQNAALNTPKTSGMAIGSLVCGILGLPTCILGLPAVILGHMSLSQINKSGGMIGGRGLAIGGLVTGYLSFVMGLLGILAALAMPAIFSAQKMAELTKETHEMKMISTSFFDYESAHGRWPVNLEDLVKEGIVTEKELNGLLEAKAEAGAEWIYFPEAISHGVEPEVLLLGPEIGGKRPLLRTDGALKQMRVEDALVKVSAQGGTQKAIRVREPTK